jgi:parvulin-like peptidyl-prolyl isomerase
MADTPKKPQGGTTADPGRPVRPTPPRRPAPRRDTEEQRQRLVVLIVGGAIGLALMSVLIGLGYEFLWKPSRPVAQVGAVTLSQRDYWAEARTTITRQIVQNFQFLALFGGNPQFTQQFQGQAPGLDRQASSVRNLPVDQVIVNGWETRQIREQGSAPLGLSVSQDEINQAIIEALGPIFLPPPPADPAAEPTAEPEATEDAATEDAASEADPAAEPTPFPTPSPLPTPTAAEAVTQVDLILNEVYRLYEIELINVGFEPNLTVEDFRTALNVQYGEQVLTTKLQESLVPEDTFVADTTPTRVRARQILIAADASDPAALAAALPDAEAIAAELRAGADFAALAAERSDDVGSREDGGVLGFFDTSGLADNGATYAPELVAAAFALPVNTISDPISTAFGWHVIEVTDQDIPATEDQLRTARTEALTAWQDEQRTALGASRFPPLTPTPTLEPTEAVPTPVPTFLPGPPTPEPTPTPDPALEPEPEEPEAEPTPTP